MGTLPELVDHYVPDLSAKIAGEPKKRAEEGSGLKAPVPPGRRIVVGSSEQARDFDAQEQERSDGIVSFFAGYCFDIESSTGRLAS